MDLPDRYQHYLENVTGALATPPLLVTGHDRHSPETESIVEND
jgi:hypothetical protein